MARNGVRQALSQPSFDHPMLMREWMSDWTRGTGIPNGSTCVRAAPSVEYRVWQSLLLSLSPRSPSRETVVAARGGASRAPEEGWALVFLLGATIGADFFRVSPVGFCPAEIPLFCIDYSSPVANLETVFRCASVHRSSETRRKPIRKASPDRQYYTNIRKMCSRDPPRRARAGNAVSAPPRRTSARAGAHSTIS